MNFKKYLFYLEVKIFGKEIFLMKWYENFFYQRDCKRSYKWTSM